MSASRTRQDLMDAAVRLTARSGVRGLTARAIGAEAGVNQALVFYHFDGVDGLLREAYASATRVMVQEYAAGLDGALTFTELYAVGERLAQRSREDGSAALLSHVLAASHHDPQMAQSLADSMGVWREVVGSAVHRVLREHGLDGALDADAVSGALSAATIGLVTMDAVPGRPLGDTMGAVSGLPRLADGLLGRFPAAVVRRVARAALRRGGRQEG